MSVGEGDDDDESGSRCEKTSCLSRHKHLRAFVSRSESIAAGDGREKDDDDRQPAGCHHCLIARQSPNICSADCSTLSYQLQYHSSVEHRSVRLQRKAVERRYKWRKLWRVGRRMWTIGLYRLWRKLPEEYRGWLVISGWDIHRRSQPLRQTDVRIGFWEAFEVQSESIKNSNIIHNGGKIPQQGWPNYRRNMHWVFFIGKLLNTRCIPKRIDESVEIIFIFHNHFLNRFFGLVFLVLTLVCIPCLLLCFERILGVYNR